MNTIIYILIAFAALLFIIIFLCCLSKCFKKKEIQKEDIESLVREQRLQERILQQQIYFDLYPALPKQNTKIINNHPKWSQIKQNQIQQPPINKIIVPSLPPLPPPPPPQPVSDDEIHILMDNEIKYFKKNHQYHLIGPAKLKYNIQIFELNNKNRDKYTIDLHGLFVKEAIIILSNLINKLIGENHMGRITVITGRGNHSKNGKALIKPEVIKYLKKNNFDFIEISDGGAFSFKVC